MKIYKLIFTILIFINPFIINGQEKYTTYYNSYDGKIYDISIELQDNGDYELYIDMSSLDKLSKSGGVIIEKKALNGFINTLNESKLKYEEWVKVAKTNNILSLNKDMPYSTIFIASYFNYMGVSIYEWHLSAFVKCSYNFKILNGKYFMDIQTPQLISSSNEYIKHDGFIIRFSTSNDILKFINTLSIDKIDNYISKPKETDLFK